MKRTNKTVFLYEDDKWLIVNKPTGLSTYAANSGGLGCVEWLELHHHIKVYVCSRLDKGTSGVLLFALTPEASGEAEAIHERGLSEKTYYFISDHQSTKGENWTCLKDLDGKKCETSFSFVRKGKGCFLYRAVISRGRRHQIRRHAAESGVPLLGDKEYGGTAFPRLCLHCAKLSWPGVPPPVEAPLPESFEALLAGSDSLLVDAAIAYERRLGWLSTVTDAFRLVHRGEVRGDIPGEVQPDARDAEGQVGDFSIDLFGSYLSVTGYDESVSADSLREYLLPLLSYFGELFACKGGIVRTNRLDPHRRKLFGELALWGEAPPDTFLVKEGDLLFEISLNSLQHPGLFLDQRDSRRRIMQLAHDRRVANLFSFTCSFSTAAVKAGAEVVFSVDLAAGSLGRGKNNFLHNHIADSGRGKFIKEDVLKWLARQIRKKNADPGGYKKWDLIICDPPVYASSGKGSSFSVERDWPRLAENIREILSETGIALFANNHMGGDEKYYCFELEKRFAKVTRFSPPFDFPELPGLPDHVRIYWCEV